MSRRSHFHVLVGLCGLYLPDDNRLFTSRKEAERAARAIVDEFRDEGEVVTGSARAGYWHVGDRYCVEITDCDEASCLVDAQT